MKLCYYKLPNGERNFGDDLNPWLWQKIIPNILDDDPKVAFIGIGSLINEGLSRRTRYATKRVIFGTGVGYGKISYKLDESYKVYCLRGKLSARFLELPENLAITDSAALIRKAFDSNRAKKYRFSYMPHYELAGRSWEIVCEKLGFGYIDPRAEVEDILLKISQTEILLAEAMHGAIIADAMRVPWIPIVTNPTILAFKWHDWCSSIEVEYQPHYINRLNHPREKQDFLTPIRQGRDWMRQQQACSELKSVAMNNSPCMSRDLLIESLTGRLEEKLQDLKQDLSNGLFE